MVQEAQRMRFFSQAVFYELTELVNERKKIGLPVIDLGIGSPDMPPPDILPHALRLALDQPGVFGYQRTEGTESFRTAIADFVKRRYQLTVDPIHEVLVTIGAQDALAHLALAFVNPGDVVLLPNPGYPIYEVSVRLADGVPYFMPLKEENNFLPNLDDIPREILQHAKMMVLNFPGNPTASLATLEYFADVVNFARTHNLIVVHDAAYIELVFDGLSAPSFLQVPGAAEVGIELHSFSKTFNFAGPRLAFALGNKQILNTLGKLKSQIDYGVFSAIQAAGTQALQQADTFIEQNRIHYQARRDALFEPLLAANWPVRKPAASMFVWLKTPQGVTAGDFSRRFLQESGIVTLPGTGFGSEGEGYVRIAMVQPPAILQQIAIEMIKRFPL